MTAGRGIVHSERTPDDLRGRVRRSHGLQLWAALPAEHEEVAPSFAHTPAAALPVHRVDGCTRARAGRRRASALRSPVQPLSPTLYVDYQLAAGDGLVLPLAEERALYGVDAPFRLDGVAVAPLQMVVLAAGEAPRLAADAAARVVLVGGEPLGPRHIWLELRRPAGASASSRRATTGRARPLRCGAGRDRVHPVAGAPAERPGQKAKLAWPRWPTRSSALTPSTTIAFMPKVTPPSMRGSAR